MSDTDDTATIKCTACQGRGWVVLLIHRHPCKDCNGTGIIEVRFGSDEDGPQHFEDS
jgi:DnaJ-class molecular chaperone